MQGKVVIVTGGAKGIGRHAAHTLAKAGATVVIADTDAERMHKTLGEVRAFTKEAIAVPVDVRDEKDVRHLVYSVADRAAMKRLQRAADDGWDQQEAECRYNAKHATPWTTQTGNWYQGRDVDHQVCMGARRRCAGRHVPRTEAIR